MPVYNGEQYLKSAINSVLTQDFENFEFLIINDGSTDNTSEILGGIRDPRVRVINLSTNKGIVTALNTGIMASRGEFVARMDCDDVSRKNRFNLQLKFLSNHTDHAVVGSFVRIVNPEQKLLYTIENPTRDQAIKKHLLTDSCLAHGSVMMRRSALLDVGMYSANKKVRHAEDYDLFVRLASKYKLANLPEYLYTRVEHKDSISHKNSERQLKAAKYISRNAKKIIKLGPFPKFSILMPTYNKAPFIAQSIESVLNQTFKDWELVIIDDGSSDATDLKVKKYKNDIRVVYLKNPHNLGKAKTRNRLVKESLGDIIGELDSDDVLYPDALRIMFSEHQNNKNVGMIYSQFEYCDQQLNPISPGFCRDLRGHETNLHNHVASAFRTYKKEILNKTSGFDVTLNGAEDLDMVYKIEEVAPILFVDKVLYKYRRCSSRIKAAIAESLISQGKAKFYAYLRRRSNRTQNITLTLLFRQLLNLGYQLAKVYMRSS